MPFYVLATNEQLVSLANFSSPPCARRAGVALRHRPLPDEPLGRRGREVMEADGIREHGFRLVLYQGVGVG